MVLLKPNMTWKKDFVKDILVRIRMMMVKLRRLWLQTMTRIMIKKILKKKKGNKRKKSNV